MLWIFESRFINTYERTVCAIGNFPYNISNQILFKSFRVQNQIQEVNEACF